MFNKPSTLPRNNDPLVRRDPAIEHIHRENTRNENVHAELPQRPSVTSTSKNTDKQETSSRLIVGPEVKLKGAEILDCDTLVVEGRVEATMDSRVIKIAKDGSFSGTVGIDIAEIHGRFDGELTARDQLIIHASGRVSGKIRYGKILIEEGGEISGDIQSLPSAEPIMKRDESTKAKLMVQTNTMQ